MNNKIYYIAIMILFWIGWIFQFIFSFIDSENIQYYSTKSFGGKDQR